MNSLRQFRFLLLRSDFPIEDGARFSFQERAFLGLLEAAVQGHGLPHVCRFPSGEYADFSSARRELSAFKNEDPDRLVFILWAFTDSVLAARRELNNIEHFLAPFKRAYRMILVRESAWSNELRQQGRDPDCGTMLLKHPSGEDGMPCLLLPLRTQYTAEDVMCLADYLGTLTTGKIRKDESTQELFADEREDRTTLVPDVDPRHNTS